MSHVHGSVKNVSEKKARVWFYTKIASELGFARVWLIKFGDVSHIFVMLAEVFLVKSVETQNNCVKEIEIVLSICACALPIYIMMYIPFPAQKIKMVKGEATVTSTHGNINCIAGSPCIFAREPGTLRVQPYIIN